MLVFWRHSPKNNIYCAHVLCEFRVTSNVSGYGVLCPVEDLAPQSVGADTWQIVVVEHRRRGVVAGGHTREGDHLEAVGQLQLKLLDSALCLGIPLQAAAAYCEADRHTIHTFPGLARQKMNCHPTRMCVSQYDAFVLCGPLPPSSRGLFCFCNAFVIYLHRFIDAVFSHRPTFICVEARGEGCGQTASGSDLRTLVVRFSALGCGKCLPLKSRSVILGLRLRHSPPRESNSGHVLRYQLWLGYPSRSTASGAPSLFLKKASRSVASWTTTLCSTTPLSPVATHRSRCRGARRGLLTLAAAMASSSTGCVSSASSSSMGT
jgi:hypothetical protein